MCVAAPVSPREWLSQARTCRVYRSASPAQRWARLGLMPLGPGRAALLLSLTLVACPGSPVDLDASVDGGDGDRDADIDIDIDIDGDMDVDVD